VKQTIGGFRDSGDGYRVQAKNGRDLGYFGSDVFKSIVFEIRFGEHLNRTVSVPYKSTILKRQR
jgi:hypothetical protein